MLAITTPGIERDHRPGDEARVKVTIGAAMKTTRLAPLGMIVSLSSSLSPSANRLQQPERADDVRPLAQLRNRQHLALGIGQIGDRDQQRHDDRQHLARR